MAWQLFRVLVEVKSPVHVGTVPVGNILRTRRFVPGKALWGAATASLAENLNLAASAESHERLGKLVRDHYRFGYLFPTTKPDFTISPFAGRNEDLFEYQFIDTYSSTAIDSSQACAAEANSLHEIEAIRHRTRELQKGDSLPVFLIGYLVADPEPEVSLDALRAALAEFQLGGKRGCGFGSAAAQIVAEPAGMFGASVGPAGVVTWPAGAPAPAHVRMLGAPAPKRGAPEPFLGREWLDSAGGAGQHIPPPVLCWQPGAVFEEEGKFKIAEYGIWESAA